MLKAGFKPYHHICPSNLMLYTQQQVDMKTQVHTQLTTIPQYITVAATFSRQSLTNDVSKHDVKRQEKIGLTLFLLADKTDQLFYP